MIAHAAGLRDDAGVPILLVVDRAPTRTAAAGARGGREPGARRADVDAHRRGAAAPADRRLRTSAPHEAGRGPVRPAAARSAPRRGELGHVAVALTGGEFECCSCSASRPGELVHRETIARTLGRARQRRDPAQRRHARLPHPQEAARRGRRTASRSRPSTAAATCCELARRAERGAKSAALPNGRYERSRPPVGAPAIDVPASILAPMDLVDQLSPRGFDCVCGNLRMAARAVSSVYDRHLAAAGVQSSQMAVLWAVSDAQGMTVKQLAARIAMHETTLIRNLRILEREGWVALKVGSDDRRQRIPSLTRAGRVGVRQGPARLEEGAGGDRRRAGREASRHQPPAGPPHPRRLGRLTTARAAAPWRRFHTSLPLGQARLTPQAHDRRHCGSHQER